MGALRAAELWRHGMVGVGEIFAGYRDGTLEDDSEVALLHAGPEHGFAAFTVPLVNVRHNAARARALGILDGREARTLVRAAEALFFKERTWERILERLPGPARATWERFAQGGLEDLKALDARACIEAAAAFVSSGTPAAPGEGRQPSSLVRVRRLTEGASAARDGRVVANASIVESLRARDDAGELSRAGLSTLLLAGWARELGLGVSEADLAEAQRDHWRRLGVASGSRASHLARSGLDQAQARRLWEDLALERKLLDHAPRLLNDGPSADEGLAFEARRSGLWARLAGGPKGRRRSKA